MRLSETYRWFHRGRFFTVEPSSDVASRGGRSGAAARTVQSSSRRGRSSLRRSRARDHVVLGIPAPRLARREATSDDRGRSRNDGFIIAVLYMRCGTLRESEQRTRRPATKRKTATRRVARS